MNRADPGLGERAEVIDPGVERLPRRLAALRQVAADDSGRQFQFAHQFQVGQAVRVHEREVRRRRKRQCHAGGGVALGREIDRHEHLAVHVTRFLVHHQQVVPAVSHDVAAAGRHQHFCQRVLVIRREHGQVGARGPRHFHDRIGGSAGDGLPQGIERVRIGMHPDRLAHAVAPCRQGMAAHLDVTELDGGSAKQQRRALDGHDLERLQFQRRAHQRGAQFAVVGRERVARGQ